MLCVEVAGCHHIRCPDPKCCYCCLRVARPGMLYTTILFLGSQHCQNIFFSWSALLICSTCWVFQLKILFGFCLPLFINYLYITFLGSFLMIVYMYFFVENIITDDGLLFCFWCCFNLLLVHDVCSSLHFLSCYYYTYVTRWGFTQR